MKGGTMVAFGRIRWGFLMFFGIVLIGLGITVMVLQQTMFIWFFAILAIIDGITTIILSITSRRISRFWWIYLLVGIIGIALGLIALLWPEIRGTTFVYYVASWAVFVGIFKVAATVQLQKGGARVFPIILGIIALGLGIFILVAPGLGSSILFWLVAGIALVVGTFFIVRAAVLRSRMIAQQQLRQAAIDSTKSPEGQ
jgi:uncharacterized membrane protein HdeD (DUF308 family)